MAALDLWLPAWIFAIALTLFVISALGYNRSREKRIGMVSVVFLIFAIKGLLLSLVSLEMFYPGLRDFMDEYYVEWFLDLAVLVFLLLVIWGMPLNWRKGETE